MRGLRVPALAVALAALVAGGCGARTSDVLGRSVTLVPREGGAPKAKGELLAVDQGRIWVRTKEGVRDFDPAALREVRVRRHNMTGGWAVRWGLVGGLTFFVSLWVGGFLQGLQWNDVTIPFIDTVKFMQPFWGARLLGGILMFVGILLFFWNVLMTYVGRAERPAETA